MSKFALISSLLSLVFVIGQVNGASAQTKEEKFGDWFYSCPEGAACRISQQLNHSELNQRIASVAVWMGQNEKPIIGITAPLGISLPNGLLIAVDGQGSSPIPVLYCDLNGCHTQRNVAEDFLEGLKKGEDMTLRFVSLDGKEHNIGFSLIGFSKAFSKLGSG